jgi:hypothetical protein
LNRVLTHNNNVVKSADPVRRADTDEMKAAFIAWRARPEIQAWANEAALFDAISKTPVGLYKLHFVDPELESAWFQPWNLEV